MALSSLRSLAGIGLLTTTMLCSSGAAFAQAAPSPTAAAPAEQNENDIVVTATRRAENLQDVPLAITALSTQTLDQQQVTGFDG